VYVKRVAILHQRYREELGLDRQTQLADAKAGAGAAAGAP
jgi:hypothetical protein